MDNSLIPRAFSPTDAKREREANAREAERSWSARNASNGSIPTGGKTTITGDIDVGDGGDINLGSGGDINVALGGAINVAGTFKYGAGSTPVDGTAIVGTDTDTVTGASTPGIFYTDTAATKYGVRFKAGQLALDSVYPAALSTPIATQPFVVPPTTQSGRLSVFANKVGMYTPGPTTDNMIEATSDQIKISRFDRVKEFCLYLGSYGVQFGYSNAGIIRAGYVAGNTGGHKLETQDASGAVTTSINTSGNGALAITATNGVTVNGAPIGSTPLVVTTLITTDQAAAADNDTAIIWNSRDCDVAMNPTGTPTRLVASIAGMYFLTGNASFSAMGGGMRGVWFRKNGTVRLRGQSNPPPSASQFAEIDAHAYARLAAGDYIEVMATVAGAAGAVTIKADNGTVGAMEWKRP